MTHVGEELRFYITGFDGIFTGDIQPSVLLVDVVASWKERSSAPLAGPPMVILYVLAPEKLVFFALAFSPKIWGTDWGHVIIIIGAVATILTDLCAFGALFAALHSGVTPPALMVGYGMTALAAVTMVLGIATNWKYFGLLG